MDLLDIAARFLPDFDLLSEARLVARENTLGVERRKKPTAKKSAIEAKTLHTKNIISTFKAGGSVHLRWWWWRRWWGRFIWPSGRFQGAPTQHQPTALAACGRFPGAGAEGPAADRAHRLQQAEYPGRQGAVCAAGGGGGCRRAQATATTTGGHKARFFFVGCSFSLNCTTYRC